MKIKYKGPRPPTGRAGDLMPSVYFDRKAARLFTDMTEEWGERGAQGCAYLVLETAGLLRKAVQAKAPVLKFAGGPHGDDVDYAQELTIEVVGSGDDPTVALVYRNKKRVLNEQLTVDKGAYTALYIIPRRSEKVPQWVRVMKRYNPWPAQLLPDKPPKGTARVVARKITKKENQDLTEILFNQRFKIDQELRTGGLHHKTLQFSSTAAQGLEVLDDVGYSILRAEFGWGGPATPAWRPAVMNLQASLGSLGRKLRHYILTGDKNVFDVPQAGTMTQAELKGLAAEFQEKILAGLS